MQFAPKLPGSFHGLECIASSCTLEQNKYITKMQEYQEFLKYWEKKRHKINEAYSQAPDSVVPSR
jgi:hypothetical protein